jgi:hypothetical protein
MAPPARGETRPAGQCFCTKRHSDFPMEVLTVAVMASPIILLQSSRHSPHPYRPRDYICSLAFFSLTLSWTPCDYRARISAARKGCSRASPPLYSNPFPGPRSRFHPTKRHSAQRTGVLTVAVPPVSISLSGLFIIPMKLSSFPVFPVSHLHSVPLVTARARQRAFGSQ